MKIIDKFEVSVRKMKYFNFIIIKGIDEDMKFFKKIENLINTGYIKM